MSCRVLVACHLGNPLDVKTWSGTPANILFGLNNANLSLEFVPFSSGLPQRQVRFVRRLDRLLLGQFGFIPGVIARYLMGKRVASITRAETCAAVLHFSTYDIPLFGSGRVKRYLFLDNTFDIWASQAHAATGMTPRLRKHNHRLEARALSKVRHVFVSGQHVARNLSEHYRVPAERITVVGTGLGAVRPYSGYKSYKNGEILSVVKERPVDKGLPLLLKAFSIARQSRPELRLTVIGAEKFKNFSPSGNVRFTSWVTEDELQRCFERASLFVLPASYEPWGLSYLEALSCKVPIIGFERNAFPEFCIDNHHGRALPPSSSADDLAAAILEQLSDPKRQEAQGLAGQTFCLETFSWARVSEAISNKITSDMSDSYVVSGAKKA